MTRMAPAIGKRGAIDPIDPKDIPALSLHEQQRVAYLVLGIARPRIKIVIGKRAGRRRTHERAVQLEPGIEEAVALREDWSHKNAGTPETHEKAARRQQGALARLFASGAIDRGQLASAEQISQIYDAIASAVTIGTASLETRVDVSHMSGDRHIELFGQVRGELAYTRWRSLVPGPVSAVIEMIVEDVALTEVARRYRMHNRRARQLLIDSLNLWPRCLGAARDAMGDDWEAESE